MRRLLKRLFAKVSSKRQYLPPDTPEMELAGLAYRRMDDGTIRVVCDFCGGNCGQCGMTGRIGNVPFDFQRMIDNSGMRK